jgi:hypothetical protein
MFYDITIRSSSNESDRRKIFDIKALREMTRLPSPNGDGVCMGLASAKALIEATYDSADNSAILRLTPEQFAAWSYNRFEGAYHESDWWIVSATAVFPAEPPAVFTF